MTLVVLAVVLNTVIFTQNLATREAVDARSPVEFVNGAELGIGGAIAEANFWNASGYAAMDAEFRRALTTWAGNASRLRASRGIVATTSLHSTANGTRVVQSSNGTWTSASDAQSWTMANDVGDVRRFNANVSRAGLATDDGADLPTSTAFRVNVTDGTNTWSLYIYRLSGTNEVEVTAIAPDGTSTTCSASDPFVGLELTTGTLAGEDCGFTFAQGVNTPFDITVEHGSNIGAKYTLVVDRKLSTVRGGVPTNTYHQQATGESPFLAPALYNATVNITVERADIRYTRNISIEPERPPAGESYQIAPSASARELVYVNESTGTLSSIDKWGKVSTYAAANPVVVGPKHANLDGDDLLEIPWVDSSGNLFIVDDDDSTPFGVGASTVETTNSSIAAGTWQGETGIAYVAESDDTIYHINTSSGVQTQVGGGIAANGVLAISDYNLDGDTDIVYVDNANIIHYYDDGVPKSTTISVAAVPGLGAGTARDVERDGHQWTPYVNSTGDVNIVDADGSVVSLQSGAAVQTGVSAFDATGDELLEVVYVNSTSQELSYVTRYGEMGDVKTSGGNSIIVNTTVGVA